LKALDACNKQALFWYVLQEELEASAGVLLHRGAPSKTVTQWQAGSLAGIRVLLQHQCCV
ncbi:Hypothetical predicted protein, partial [Marmota monax]